jgi:hypothetical protein
MLRRKTRHRQNYKRNGSNQSPNLICTKYLPGYKFGLKFYSADLCTSVYSNKTWHICVIWFCATLWWRDTELRVMLSALRLYILNNDEQSLCISSYLVCGFVHSINIISLNRSWSFSVSFSPFHFHFTLIITCVKAEFETMMAKRHLAFWIGHTQFEVPVHWLTVHQ